MRAQRSTKRASENDDAPPRRRTRSSVRLSSSVGLMGDDITEISLEDEEYIVNAPVAEVPVEPSELKHNLYKHESEASEEEDPQDMQADINTADVDLSDNHDEYYDLGEDNNEHASDYEPIEPLDLRPMSDTEIVITKEPASEVTDVKKPISEVKFATFQDLTDADNVSIAHYRRMRNVTEKACSNALSKQYISEKQSLIKDFESAVLNELDHLTNVVAATSKVAQHLHRAQTDQRQLMEQLVGVWRKRKDLSQLVHEQSQTVATSDSKQEVHIGMVGPSNEITLSRMATIFSAGWNAQQRIDQTLLQLATN